MEEKIQLEPNEVVDTLTVNAKELNMFYTGLQEVQMPWKQAKQVLAPMEEKLKNAFEVIQKENKETIQLPFTVLEVDLMMQILEKMPLPIAYAEIAQGLEKLKKALEEYATKKATGGAMSVETVEEFKPVEEPIEEEPKPKKRRRRKKA